MTTMAKTGDSRYREMQDGWLKPDCTGKLWKLEVFASRDVPDARRASKIGIKRRPLLRATLVLPACLAWRGGGLLCCAACVFGLASSRCDVLGVRVCAGACAL